MGSSPPSTKKLDLLLPKPPKENLVSHFILGEIIDHISLIYDDFPEVDIPLLKKHLWKIMNKNVEPEGHLRAFLQVFQKTKVFKDAFDELDDGMKVQLSTFIVGGGEDVVWAAGGKGKTFHLPPSPAVKHHFREVAKEIEEKVDELFHQKGHSNGANDTNGIAIRPVEIVQEQVHKVQEKVDEFHERVGEFFRHDDNSHDVNGNAVHEEAVDEFAVKPPVANGHVEHAKEGLHKLFHHEKHDPAIKSTITNDNVIDEFAVKPVTNGHIEKAITSTGGFPCIYEDQAETKTMEVYGNKEFQNWGQCVRNTPLWTFVPKTVLGLQNLVKWAKVHDFRVRCGGYRHSWSSTFSQEKQILVSLLNLEEVTKLPDAMSIEPEYVDPNNELKVIQFAAPPGVVASQADKALVRVGVSVTNEQFRRWAVHNDKWTLPVDVILVEVTIGGVNGPICHGAGRRHQTVNDYVRAVEYIDANGEHRTISDPEHLKAAAGHFGLLGVVTHVTLELDKMSYAVLQPVKPDIGLAIPPLHREDIPIALRKTFTDKQYQEALDKFEKHASDDYYSEWFWFTRSQQAWVNCWNTTDDKTNLVEYPSQFLTWFQWVEGWLGMVLTTSPLFHALPGRWQAELLATFGMVNLPPFEFSSCQQDETKSIVTALPNALHFRRGIQNMRVRDLEFQIPIPGLPSDPTKPDYSVVRKAWWDIINLTYEDDDCPMRLTMELRIMGDSKLIMAPQNGNTHGTASIEVLSVPDAVPDGEWQAFLQRVSDLWMSYTDAEGKPLNVRPHWAKEWYVFLPTFRTTSGRGRR
ncbi:hypothetical protein N431DRAFT_5852 [Stipitochalara longipes BDJ]|nr:hypothetical protein N431DRAFT_5852 [Stipitochalara longipes BDJ]